LEESKETKYLKNTLKDDFLVTYEGDFDFSHKYFCYADKHASGIIPYATLLLINWYAADKKLTSKQWKKETRTIDVRWTDLGPRNVVSAPINYKILLNHIKENGNFIPEKLSLPKNREEFFDKSTNFALASHLVDDNSKPRINMMVWNRDEFLGEDFPIKPSLKREGICIESFLSKVIERVIQKRDYLIQNSDKFYSFDWLFVLRDLVNDSISSIDIALNLVYNKAKYYPNPNWTFDEEKLGSKNGRRFKDKLKWIRIISGNNFDIESFTDSIFLLKEIRNHLNHFDPPSFCLAAEETPKVLNAVMDIGRIHIEMRKALDLQVSTQIINLFLQKPATFIPRSKYSNRAIFEDEGYSSCRWRNE